MGKSISRNSARERLNRDIHRAPLRFRSYKVPEPVPAHRQYVAVNFGGASAKTFTYHNDGEPLAIGDKATVNTKNGAIRTVEVVELFAEAPPFDTQPAFKLPPPKAAAGEAVDG